MENKIEIPSNLDLKFKTLNKFSKIQQAIFLFFIISRINVKNLKYHFFFNILFTSQSLICLNLRMDLEHQL